jgi:hypothetical protein
MDDVGCGLASIWPDFWGLSCFNRDCAFIRVDHLCVDWLVHGSCAPLLVCADTGANFAVQRVSLDLSQRHDPNMGHISIPLITLLIGVMLVWVARQEKQ